MWRRAGCSRKEMWQNLRTLTLEGRCVAVDNEENSIFASTSCHEIRRRNQKFIGRNWRCYGKWNHEKKILAENPWRREISLQYCEVTQDDDWHLHVLAYPAHHHDNTCQKYLCTSFVDYLFDLVEYLWHVKTTSTSSGVLWEALKTLKMIHKNSKRLSLL